MAHVRCRFGVVCSGPARSGVVVGKGTVRDATRARVRSGVCSDRVCGEVRMTAPHARDAFADIAVPPSNPDAPVLPGTGPAWDAGIVPGSPETAGGAALLYSGGCDSTLAASRLAERFGKVHLITLTRFGFIETDNPSVHGARMRERFPSTTFLEHKIPYGPLYEEVEAYRRLRNLWNHGALTSIPCGHCKVAMHWRNVLFCLENGVKYAADGAVTTNDQFAEQNPRILMPELIEFYAHYGITLVHPVHVHGLDTEAELFRLGVTDSPQVKRTTKDKQVICSQHLLFAMVMRRYLASHTFEEYEAEMKTYMRAKLAHLRELTDAWLAQPRGSRIAKLLG